MKKLFQENLKKMIGKKCWAIAAGPGTGSMAIIDIGDKIKMASSISNEHLSELSKHYEGEFNIHINCCAWRLSKQNTVVCTWNNSQSEIGRLLESLLEKKIIDIQIDDFYDLNVKFQQGFMLQLFCEQVDYENYSIKTPKGIFSVEKRNKLELCRPKREVKPNDVPRE